MISQCHFVLQSRRIRQADALFWNSSVASLGPVYGLATRRHRIILDGHTRHIFPTEKFTINVTYCKYLCFFFQTILTHPLMHKLRRFYFSIVVLLFNEMWLTPLRLIRRSFGFISLDAVAAITHKLSANFQWICVKLVIIKRVHSQKAMIIINRCFSLKDAPSLNW